LSISIGDILTLLMVDHRGTGVSKHLRGCWSLSVRWAAVSQFGSFFFRLAS
jgi:hypothetical protein